MSENHAFSERIPQFQTPTSFLSPQISNLIKDSNHFCEDGIAFKGYRRANPIDGAEVFRSGGRSLNFLFQVRLNRNQPTNGQTDRQVEWLIESRARD